MNFASLDQFDAFIEEICSLEREAEVAFQAILEIAPNRKFQGLTWNPNEARRFLTLALSTRPGAHRDYLMDQVKVNLESSANDAHLNPATWKN